ncbi:MAG: metallophosphoesterase family protein [bacterium]
MKILIISDTHGNLPISIEKIGADAVIHAGDVGDRKFFAKFAHIENFFAVAGNTDFYLEGHVPETVCEEIGGVKIFMVHNLSAPHRVIMANYREIKECDPDIVVYGHTHSPDIKEKEGVVYINPGSLGTEGLTGHKSYAILEIEKSKTASVKIYDVDSGVLINSKKIEFGEK